MTEILGTIVLTFEFRKNTVNVDHIDQTDDHRDDDDFTRVTKHKRHDFVVLRMQLTLKNVIKSRFRHED